MPAVTWLAAVHLVSTLLMAGVILFVQIVHYPLMAGVGRDGFVAYEAGHGRRTGLVVIPLMTTELAAAVWLWVSAGPAARPVASAGLALLAVIWLTTAGLSVPCHRRLSRGFDADAHRRLVASNWIRTLCWLARVPVALLLAVPS
ncbi:MAG: hypothetical protein RH859_05560 [Longimicrobiales bacterium]